jgi:hypothetical protein
MVLKKHEKEGITKAIYSSSNICASTYDNNTGNLILIFNNGGQYNYAGVSKTDYMRFEIADSQGSVMNTHIKKYAFSKLDKVDPAGILKEVAEIKATIDPVLTTEEATKIILQGMTSIISNYISNGNLKEGDLKTMEESISKYRKTITTPVLVST